MPVSSNSGNLTVIAKKAKKTGFILGCCAICCFNGSNFILDLFLVYFRVFVGDLPYEAHVQTYGGGTPSEPPVASEDRVPQHPHTHLPHLSSPAPWQQVGFRVYVRLELMRPCTHSHLHKAYISIMTADISIQC